MIPRDLFEVAFDPAFGRQMRFITGPRQSGKTTLAKQKLKQEGCESCYFNWDLRSIRTRYRENPFFYSGTYYALPKGPKKFWICFDEIHKMPKWKNILKGGFDEKEKETQFIVTGSARMDWFRKSGDSLAGRYFLFRLFPVTLRELFRSKSTFSPPKNASDFIEAQLSTKCSEEEIFSNLLNLGGFPEPLTKQSKTFHQKWQEAYTDQIVREDLRDLTGIRELENVAALCQILPARIGSPLSLNALHEDLEVSYNAVRGYLRALELAYMTFSLSPYQHRIIRSVKKEKKVYFYDWTRVADPSIRFENFVAVQLQARLALWNDRGLGPFELFYVRTKDGKETDFLVTRQRMPWLLLEAKLSPQSISPHHFRHAEQLGEIPFIQIVRTTKEAEKKGKRYWTISANRLLC